MKNPNAPGKGVEKTVEPIRRLKDIRAITTLLASSPRDHLLFTMGVNNGLRTGDLLRLRVRDVRDKQPGEAIVIVEQKTKKKNYLMINKPVHKSLQVYLETVDPEDDDFLFASRKGGGPLTVPSVNRLIKSWTDQVNLPGRYGAHSLRKTWGYIQRTQFGTSFELICKRYLHSSPAVTMRYLGIQEKEIHETLLHEIG
jgi:integrase